jgi:hypothetical protein
VVTEKIKIKKANDRMAKAKSDFSQGDLWQPCLLTDRDEISNLYKGPSIDASYQISVHLVKGFQRRRFFRNQPIRKKNGLWWPCLLTDWN